MVSCHCHKPVTGDKNGATQVFQVGSMPRYYPTEEKAVHSLQKPFCRHMRTLVLPFPGPFCSSSQVTTEPKCSFPEAAEEACYLGLNIWSSMLVSFCWTQKKFVIATSIKIDLKNLHTSYSCSFKKKPLKSSLQEGETFDTEKKKYQIRKQSNIHQKAVDLQLMPEMKAVA